MDLWISVLMRASIPCTVCMGSQEHNNRLVHVLFQQIQIDKEMTFYLMGQATENWSCVAYKFWMQTHVEIRKEKSSYFA